MNNEEALVDLEKRYLTPGDPLFMAGIQRIKDHYKSTIPIKAIKDFLARSRAYTVHFEYRPVIHNPYYIRRLRQMIQIDLIEISKMKEHNKGYKYILVAIDCFSRKIWARLLSKKTAGEVLSKLKSILKETGHVESICSDRGAEFVNKKMKDYLEKNGIKLINPYTSTHAHFVERVQSTLQTIIFKYITSAVSMKFYHKLQDFVKTYNRRKHRITKLSPDEGEKEENHLHIQNMQEDYRAKIKSTKKAKFKVGDIVRIAATKGKFFRGYDRSSKEEQFRIVEVNTKLLRPLYTLAALDGEEIKGNFYQEQLTKVLKQEKFLIEKILKKGKKKTEVKFYGYEKPELVENKEITNAFKDIE